MTKYAGNLAQLAIHLEELEQNIEKTVAESDEIIRKVQEAQQIRQASAVPEESVSEEVSLEQQETEERQQEGEQLNHNQMILEKYRDGKSAIEIAKELGLGVGEVRLVIGLFREEEL